ncbi:MAG: hypothetical protein ACKV1O_05885 [Saprospiraceae bacterium]
MKNVRRSLIIGFFAGACMLLFMMSPTLFPNVKWVWWASMVLVLPLSVLGFGLGIKSVQAGDRGIWAWVAVWLNSLIMIGFLSLAMSLFDEMLSST